MSTSVIAIDGYSSTGKSTLAKQIAREKGYIYLDSGAMFRALTYFALQRKLIDLQTKELKEESFVEKLSSIDLEYYYDVKQKKSYIFLNKENVESYIRSLYVSNFVSIVAKVPKVREVIVKLQRKIVEQSSSFFVIDGRDIGTVVFPNAQLKFFITASANIRAERRHQELKAQGENYSFEEVLKNIKERDYKDMHREVAPLRKAEDAIEIDNSELSLAQQWELVNKIITKRIK